MHFLFGYPSLLIHTKKDRDQRTDDSGQMTDDREQKSEVGGRKSEIRAKRAGDLI